MAEFIICKIDNPINGFFKGDIFDIRPVGSRKPIDDERHEKIVMYPVRGRIAAFLRKVFKRPVVKASTQKYLQRYNDGRIIHKRRYKLEAGKIVDKFTGVS